MPLDDFILMFISYSVLLYENVSRHDSKCVGLKLINVYDIVTVDDLLKMIS